MATDWTEFAPETETKTVDWNEFAPEQREGEAIAIEPDRQREREDLANQMRLARAERGLSDVIAAIPDVGKGIATAIVQAASKVDPTQIMPGGGFFQNMMARQNIPQSQLVPPEMVRGDIEIASQFANQALGNLGINLNLPPSLTEPVKEFAAENIAALPELAPAMAAGVAHPVPVGRYFQAQMLSQLPQSVQALAESQTPKEAVKAGLGTAASVAFPVGIELGIRPKPTEVPPYRGTQIPIPEGAPVPRPPKLPRPEVPESVAEAQILSEILNPPEPVAPKPIATWEDAVAELKAKGTGQETKAQIQAMFPQLQLKREVAGELARDAFGDAWAPGQEKGETQNASEISKATEVYGDVRTQPVEGARQVPVEESGAGIQSQTGGGIPEAQAPNASQGQPRFLLSDTAKQKLRGIGWDNADFADLEAGNLSVTQIVDRKLQPFEGGGGPDHAKALEEARTQAKMDAFQILEEKPAPKEWTTEEISNAADNPLDQPILTAGPEVVAMVRKNEGDAAANTVEALHKLGISTIDTHGFPGTPFHIRLEPPWESIPWDIRKALLRLGKVEIDRNMVVDPQNPAGEAGITFTKDVSSDLRQLLKSLPPEERLAEQRAPDEALGQETSPQISQMSLSEVNAALESVNAELKDLNKGYITGKTKQAARAPLKDTQTRLLVRKQLLEKQPTPLPEATPTVPPAAEPSQLTPTQQGSQVEPISKATTPSQITQAPFLDIPPEKWTPEYWKRIGDEGRRTVRGNLQGALQKIGSKTKVTERSSPQAVFNAIAEVNKARVGTSPKPPLPPGPGAKTAGEPPIEPMQAGLGIPGIEKLDRKFDELRQGFGALVKSGPERRRMDQTFDAAENMANIVARQATNKLRLNGTPAELDAIYPFIEAKGDINRLQHFIVQATGKNEAAVSAAQYALSHWNDPHFRNLARRAKLISDRQIAQEQAAGINTEYRDAYLPHLYDRDLLMGFNRPFVIGGGGGGGMRTGFKKGRTFETIYDAIEAGYPVKSLNAADTLESRVRSGQKLINRVEWADSFRNVVDPTDSQPIVTSLVRHSRGTGQPGWEAPPPGYARRTIIPGVDVAVHEGYTSLFDALTGTSRIAGSVPGKLILEAEGALKHGLLLFDTYHVSRILQKEAALLGGRHMGWRKGLTLLEYGDTELNAALREGLITREMADFARANRADAELLIRSGLNVGRIQENLYNSFVRHMPGIGRFNKWVFEKMTRGAMLQSALIELERVQRDFGLTRQDAAMKVSRDLNAYFGNLGRQGIFKSATSQDLARIVALAPQWVESMLRTEVGGVAKAVIDPIKYRKLAVSSLPLGVGTGLAAYFVGAQILNLVTRGKLTWENPEKGHKLDAWIPDFTGKTGGYFLSPFSVPAEITHDMIRYSKSEPDAIAAASRILSNKQSPLYRATKTLLTGKDWTGEKLIGSWNRVKAAAVNLIPAPIGIAPLLTGETYPGQTQRQITASLGVKTEPAPTALQQIRELKKEWGLNNADPKTKHQFEQALKADYGTGDYNDLRRALSAGDMKKANEAYDALISLGKKRADIVDALSWYSGGKEVNGVYRERKVKPIGGQIGAEAEKKFIASLNPAEKRLYQQAMDERKRIYQKFLELLKSR